MNSVLNAQFAGGDGTQADPYQVSTAAQLDQVRNYMTSYFVQTADIDLSSFPNWLPIGDETNKFAGKYNGQNHIISNLIINRPSTNFVGLFGYTENSEIKNLGIVGSSITGRNYAGGLLGLNNYGTISNCFITGNLTGQNYTGGLAGSSYGSISNCYSTKNVTGSSYVGGLVGWFNEGSVTNSYWDKETSGKTTSSGGTGLTTAQMTGNAAKTNMTGFDFETIWSVTTTYPKLKSFVITQNPVSQTKYLGENITFAVSATNAVSYQWKKNGQNINGATNANLIFTISNLSDSGYYSCVLTNFYGSLLSDSAKLTVINPFTLGDGSVENPYQVSNADQLNSVRYFLNKCFIQTADIDLSTYPNWLPIGDAANKFLGLYDGNAHFISNLNINRPTTDDVGLFGYTYYYNSEIKNLGIVGGNVVGRNNVGSMVGNSISNISQCFSKVNVSGADYVGGFAGRSGRSVENCFVIGNVSGINYVGGFVAVSSYADLHCCFSVGQVSGTSNVAGSVADFSNGGYGGLYWDIEISGITTSDAGNGLTTAQMTGNAATTNMAGFNFSTIWAVQTNSYPKLRVFLPVIATQPVLQTKNLGENITFAVSATNAVSYQWKKNGQNINGATSELSMAMLLVETMLADSSLLSIMFRIVISQEQFLELILSADSSDIALMLRIVTPQET